MGSLSGFLLFIFIPIFFSNYIDVPILYKASKLGRTKNAISAVVAGIVAQRIYGESEIDLIIEKFFFPDAKLTGSTTQDSIFTNVELMFTNAQFIGYGSEKGELKGTIKKSQFNWELIQTGTNKYLYINIRHFCFSLLFSINGEFGTKTG
jgi:hypothetical protein